MKEREDLEAMQNPEDNLEHRLEDFAEQGMSNIRSTQFYSCNETPKVMSPRADRERGAESTIMSMGNKLPEARSIELEREKIETTPLVYENQARVKSQGTIEFEVPSKPPASKSVSTGDILDSDNNVEVKSKASSGELLSNLNTWSQWASEKQGASFFADFLNDGKSP